jgi:hypothetical protein
VIPDEFSVGITHPLTAEFPHYASKIAVAELLKKDQSRIAHTLIFTGAFLDWGLDNDFLGFDVTNHTVTLFDEGRNLFSGTTVPHITKAVVAAIRHPELTLNKRIFIADVSFAQQQALALFEKYTDAKWTVNHVSSKEEIKNAEESLKKGDLQNGIRP